MNWVQRISIVQVGAGPGVLLQEVGLQAYAAEQDEEASRQQCM